MLMSNLSKMTKLRHVLRLNTKIKVTEIPFLNKLQIWCYLSSSFLTKCLHFIFFCSEYMQIFINKPSQHEYWQDDVIIPDVHPTLPMRDNGIAVFWGYIFLQSSKWYNERAKGVLSCLVILITLWIRINNYPPSGSLIRCEHPRVV